MKDSTLLLPFLDQSESFTHGFECGQIWQKISEGECFERHLVHTENKEQINMICESFGVDAEIIDFDETWSYLTVKNIKINLVN